MNSVPSRKELPKPTDRLLLGSTGLTVSPICIGITEDPETIPAAFDAGINFFFLTADLHWPLYEQIRRGLGLLLKCRPSVRDQIVIAVVSYLDQPLFQALQFHEVIGTVSGMDHVDIILAGAVSNEQSFLGRLNEQLGPGRYHSIYNARAARQHGARAIGASFHDRRTALLSLNHNLLDITYVRYNAGHPGAATDIFPYLRPDRAGLIFNFKSVMSYVTPERIGELGLSDKFWVPKITDHYRFVMSNPYIDGLLCSPANPAQLAELLAAFDEPVLTAQEQAYMLWLSSVASSKYF